MAVVCIPGSQRNQKAILVRTVPCSPLPWVFGTSACHPPRTCRGVSEQHSDHPAQQGLGGPRPSLCCSSKTLTPSLHPVCTRGKSCGQGLVLLCVTRFPPSQLWVPVAVARPSVLSACWYTALAGGGKMGSVRRPRGWRVAGLASARRLGSGSGSGTHSLLAWSLLL